MRKFFKHPLVAVFVATLPFAVLFAVNPKSMDFATDLCMLGSGICAGFLIGTSIKDKLLAKLARRDASYRARVREAFEASYPSDNAAHTRAL